MPILSEPFESPDDYLVWVEQRPDEEHYEVVDGQPVTSPSPTGRHQRVLMNLAVVLRSCCPTGHTVLPAPWDWVLWQRPRLQLRKPDLVVVTREQTELPRLESPPLLAVEILSPTSFERDVSAKRRDYARAGLDHYWIVDPEAPQVAIYRRVGDDMEMVAHAVGTDEVTVEEPFAARLRPATC